MGGWLVAWTKGEENPIKTNIHILSVMLTSSLKSVQSLLHDVIMKAPLVFVKFQTENAHLSL